MGERAAPLPTPSAAPRQASRRRVLVEDARRDGHHLRATWHPGERQFVVSTWHEDVCTGASRISAADAAALTRLLVDGLADASRPTRGATPKLPDTRAGLPGLVDRLRWLVTGTAPRRAARQVAGDGGTPAAGASGVVRPLKRDSA